jgi:hypothetical protein
MRTPEWLKAGLYGTGAVMLLATPLASVLAVPAETRSSGTTRAGAIAAENATGSVAKSAEEDSDCRNFRRKLWIEGEGWIVRRLTTCHRPRPTRGAVAVPIERFQHAQPVPARMPVQPRSGYHEKADAEVTYRRSPMGAGHFRSKPCVLRSYV